MKFLQIYLFCFAFSSYSLANASYISVGGSSDLEYGKPEESAKVTLDMSLQPGTTKAVESNGPIQIVLKNKKGKALFVTGAQPGFTIRACGGGPTYLMTSLNAELPYMCGMHTLDAWKNGKLIHRFMVGPKLLNGIVALTPTDMFRKEYQADGLKKIQAIVTEFNSAIEVGDMPMAKVKINELISLVSEISQHDYFNFKIPISFEKYQGLILEVRKNIFSESGCGN